MKLKLVPFPILKKTRAAKFAKEAGSQELANKRWDYGEI
jgi:hypothetical protein